MTPTQTDLKVWRTYVSGANAVGITTNLHGWSLASTYEEARQFAVQQQLDTQGIVTTDFSITLLPTEIAVQALLHNTVLCPAQQCEYVHDEQAQQTTGYAKSSNRLLVWQVVSSQRIDRILRIGKLSKVWPIVHRALRIWPALSGKS